MQTTISCKQYDQFLHDADFYSLLETVHSRRTYCHLLYILLFKIIFGFIYIYIYIDTLLFIYIYILYIYIYIYTTLIKQLQHRNSVGHLSKTIQQDILFHPRYFD